MPLYWRNKALLAKIETVYGTDPTPTGAANAILATDVKLSPMEGQDVSRGLDSRPYMGAQPTVPVGLHAKLSFKVEVKGSGAAGTPPACGVLLRSCALAEVIVAATSVTYNPITTAHESCTIYLNIDGTLYKMLGCRGTMVCRVTAQGIAYFEFEITGLFTQPSAAAVPAVTLGTQMTQMPQAATSANTPTFTINGVACVMRSFALNLGNEVKARMLVRSESVIIPDKAEMIDTTVEAVALATLNPYPQQLGTAQTLPEGAIEIAASADLTRLARMRLADGVWIDRPQPMATVEPDAAGAAIVTVSGAAPGSRLVVIDLEWGEPIFSETFDVAGQWRLPDPGGYAVEVEAPPPWLPLVLRVEVPA